MFAVARTDPHSWVHIRKRRACGLATVSVLICAVLAAGTSMFTSVHPWLKSVPTSGAMTGAIESAANAVPAELQVIVSKNATVSINQPVPYLLQVPIGSYNLRVAVEDGGNSNAAAQAVRRKFSKLLGNAASAIHAVVFGSRALTLDLGAMSPVENATYYGGGLVPLRYRSLNLAREPALEVPLAMACEAITDEQAQALIVASREARARPINPSVTSTSASPTGASSASATAAAANGAKRLESAPAKVKSSSNKKNGVAKKTAAGASSTSTGKAVSQTKSTSLASTSTANASSRLVAALLNSTSHAAQESGMDVPTYRLTSLGHRMMEDAESRALALPAGSAITTAGLLGSRLAIGNGFDDGELQAAPGQGLPGRPAIGPGGQPAAAAAPAPVPVPAGIAGVQAATHLLGIDAVTGQNIAPTGLTSAYVCTRETVMSAVSDLKHNTLFEKLTDPTWLAHIVFWGLAYLSLLEAGAFLTTRVALVTCVLWPVLVIAWRSGNMRGRPAVGHVARLSLLTALPIMFWVKVVHNLLPPPNPQAGPALASPANLARALRIDDAALQIGVHIFVTVAIAAHFYDDGPEPAAVATHAAPVAVAQAGAVPAVPAASAASVTNAQPRHDNDGQQPQEVQQQQEEDHGEDHHSHRHHHRRHGKHRDREHHHRRHRDRLHSSDASSGDAEQDDSSSEASHRRGQHNRHRHSRHRHRQGRRDASSSDSGSSRDKSSSDDDDTFDAGSADEGLRRRHRRHRRHRSHRHHHRHADDGAAAAAAAGSNAAMSFTSPQHLAAVQLQMQQQAAYAYRLQQSLLQHQYAVMHQQQLQRQQALNGIAGSPAAAVPVITSPASAAAHSVTAAADRKASVSFADR